LIYPFNDFNINQRAICNAVDWLASAPQPSVMQPQAEYAMSIHHPSDGSFNVSPFT
jgi:hypothetical protein